MTDGSRAYMDAHRLTLQWHLTQKCDLSCRHCYDRSDREELPLARSLDILDDLGRFCETKHVRGAVTFSGGNPLLYPRFAALYKAAVDHGFSVAILGNPVERPVLQELLEVAKPDFFQVSLEGPEARNDHMRGTGHFRRTLRFLDTLRDFGIFSMVMLTLTEENVNKILPLAASLQDKVDVFHFNRLSRTGMGMDLSLPSRERYRSFLEEYVAASRENPVLGLKDNLLNIVLAERGEAPFGGCTGFGCGAAFNFLTLLPDGEIHACRKFPSLLGNVLHASLRAIYDSEEASGYRRRPAVCRGCALRAMCGGCLAVIQTHNLDISKDRDPLCFCGTGQ
jgi:selenobiotic family peptide radical SAM maturase